MRISCAGVLSVVAAALALAAVSPAPLQLWANGGTQGSAPAQRAQDAPAGNVENGKKAFAARNCAMCHGSEGQGAIGPRIGPPGRALADFVHYVRQPTGQMPAVTSQAVPDSVLTDIYAYLRSLGPQSTLSAAAGNAQNGKRIFTSYGCYQCHGGEGQGSIQTGGPRIGPPSLSFPAFAGYVRQPTNQMPPYTTKAVSDADLADIYAFLQARPVPPPVKSIPLLNE